MSPEQKRERLLKRVLPALAIGTGYLVFLGPRAVDDAAKARQELAGYQSRGIAPDALPGLQRRKAQVDAEVAGLKAAQTDLDKSLRGLVDFLGKPDYANGMVNRVSKVLAAHGLPIRDTVKAPAEALESAPPSVFDIAQKLGEPAALAKGAAKPAKAEAKPKLGGWRFRFSGPYPKVYQALRELASGDFPVLPLSLAMSPPKELGSEMEWTLVVWSEAIPPNP